MRCLCFGETGDLDIPALPCMTVKLPHPDISEEETVEVGILKLFAERNESFLRFKSLSAAIKASKVSAFSIV